MAKMLFGVVYDAQTLAIRRIVVPDDDVALLDRRHLTSGEAMATAPLMFGIGLDSARAAVIQKAGRTPQ